MAFDYKINTERRRPKVSSINRGQSMPMGTMLNRAYEMQDVEAARAQAALNPFQKFNIPEDERTDYVLKPQFRSVHGIPVEERVPELKPEIPIAQFENIRSGRAKAVGLDNRLQQLMKSQNIQKNLSPTNIMAHRGWIGNMVGSIASLSNSKDISEFLEFKSGTDRLFQEYRKYITGVQAGFPEIQFLQPIFPQPTDPPSKYVATALSALEDMKVNDQMILESLGQAGYRTRNLEGGFDVDPEALRSSAMNAGINVGPSRSPIPGMPTYRSEGSDDIDVEQERQLAASMIQKGADARKVAQRFKQRTGVDLNG